MKEETYRIRIKSKKGGPSYFNWYGDVPVTMIGPFLAWFSATLEAVETKKKKDK